MWNLIEDIMPPENVKILVFGHLESSVARVARLIIEDDKPKFQIVLDNVLKSFNLEDFTVWSRAELPCYIIKEEEIMFDELVFLWDIDENVARRSYLTKDEYKEKYFIIQGLGIMDYNQTLRKFSHIYKYPKI